jgi:hypothetical protein
MLSLAFLIALAICICGGSAQNSGGDAISQPWFLNVTVGGIFDEIAQCAVSLHKESSPSRPTTEARAFSTFG